jgi:hypothetical protein
MSLLQLLAGGRGEHWLPHLPKMHRDDTACPYHDHTTAAGHSDTSDHYDNPTMDYYTRYQASSRMTASLSRGATSVSLHLVGQHQCKAMQ